MPFEAVRSLRERGYAGETRLQVMNWPTGGPAPSVLEFEPGLPVMAVGDGEEAYLTRRAPGGNGGVRMGGPGGAEKLGDEVPREGTALDVAASDALAVKLEGLAEDFAPRRIVVLGWDAVVMMLRERFPKARIQVIEHDSLRFIMGAGKAEDVPEVEMMHLPMDGALPWFDSRAMEWEEMDLLVVPDGGDRRAEDIRRAEMKGMEAYGRDGNLRGNYVVGAVGCKRSGIEALKTFLDSGEATGLIYQDDCHWQSNANEIVIRAFRELPSDWEMVYFSASARERHEPFSPHLVRLRGARLCTAILWKRATAMRLLPELEACDTEWDLFMQRSHSRSKAYCVVPMPAFQARSHSDIVGGMVQPANR